MRYNYHIVEKSRSRRSVEKPQAAAAMLARAVSLLALALVAAALNNGFTKPEMGLNTWESWGCDISEQKVHAAADAMVSLISDPNLPLPETDRYFRSLEFHDSDVRTAVLQRLLP